MRSTAQNRKAPVKKMKIRKLPKGATAGQWARFHHEGKMCTKCDRLLAPAAGRNGLCVDCGGEE